MEINQKDASPEIQFFTELTKPAKELWRITADGKIFEGEAEITDDDKAIGRVVRAFATSYRDGL